MSKILSGAHTRYHIRYHFVWIVKYRKNLLLRSELKDSMKEFVVGICERYDFEMDTIASDGNHLHLFLGAKPKYAPSRIAEIVKSISTKLVFENHPEVKEELWGGEFWGDGYFVRTVGDEVNSEVIRKYINNQGQKTAHKDFDQLSLW